MLVDWGGKRQDRAGPRTIYCRTFIPCSISYGPQLSLIGTTDYLELVPAEHREPTGQLQGVRALAHVRVVQVVLQEVCRAAPVARPAQSGAYQQVWAGPQRQRRQGENAVKE